MALYTPPSLPRTPSSCMNINTTLPSLPTELLATWSSWRPRMPANLLTPPSPMSAALQRLTTQPPPQVTSLPPITHFDRQLSAMAPLTPPLTQDASTWSKSIPQTDLAYPSPDHMDEDIPSEPPFPQKQTQSDDTPYNIDWSDFSLKRSSHFIAEKTCEMICYLWFSTSVSQRVRSVQDTSPSESTRATSALQFTASPMFIQFMQKLLETTQVSQSVIVLSLHYIYRLKERNRLTAGLAGSEFRIAVAALMMANKFLDDNTYTNKTWSEVSGIGLAEINRMEREFLVGIDFGLYVDNATYESWLNLLKGLVMAKERDCRQWRKSRARHRSSIANPVTSVPSSRTYKLRSVSSYRARSTSPTETYRVFSSNHETLANSDLSPTPQQGSKRSAADAFSPTSTSFHELPPLKRPTGIILQIPEHRCAGGSNSASPLESLISFAKMSLASSPHSARTPQMVLTPPDTTPETLVAAYRVEKPVNIPQNLYYYSLAGSSIDSEVAEPKRKTRLRCYQPPSPSNYYRPPPAYMPVGIQSASVSPRETHMGNSHVPLPHYQDSVWSRKFAPPVYTPSPNTQLAPIRQNAVPFAPFANAGPPGFQFYTSSQRTSPVYPYNWSTYRRQ